MSAVQIGEIGAYCVRCRRFLEEDELIPLKGKHSVKPTMRRRLGEEIGRHRTHPGTEFPVSWVRRTE